MKKTILALTTSFVLMNGFAQAAEGYDDIGKSSTKTVFNQEALKSKPSGTPETPKLLIPSNGIIALNKNNKLEVLTSNGRFVLKGVLYDTWAKKDLVTYQDIVEYATKIPLKSLNINMNDLQSATWGKGSNQIIMFTDPYCAVCQKAIKDITDLDPSKYTLHVLSIGALGDNSKKRNFELYCAKDRYRADRAIISFDNKTTFEQIPNCDREALMRREITSQIFGVSMIPFVIRNDGVYSVGEPKGGFKRFIESKGE